MPYIYKIVNNINNKIYIGKTNLTVEKRWKEHCFDSTKKTKEKRPLYSAMNKYGIDNFSIEQIERVNTDEEACEREKYWIEYYGSFKYGYNATKGGDGRAYADYDLIYALWNSGKNNKEIQKILNYDHDTITKALGNRGVTAEERSLRGLFHRSKAVVKMDKDTEEILEVYYSCAEAERQIGGSSGNVSRVCNGKRKTYKGYKWKYL